MNAGRLFVKVIFILVTLVILIGQAQAQDKICISREAAEQCALNVSKVVALEARILVLEQALKDKDKIIEDLKVDGALKTGRIIALEQNDASNRAIIVAMIPMLRPKVVGLKIF